MVAAMVTRKSLIVCLAAAISLSAPGTGMAQSGYDGMRGYDGALNALSAPGAVKPAPLSARFGPFRVTDASRAVFEGVSDRRSPAYFAAMMKAHPRIRVLELHDCPGTMDDLANMQLGRMIRAAGLATHVPDGGSVRSGAVELFLAGVVRHIDDGAEFAVHAWMDEDGREAADYPADSSINLRYLNYYQEMGMAAGHAAAFYAMTNSVSFSDARWLDAQEMRHWLNQPVEMAGPATKPKLAYLDLALALP